MSTSLKALIEKQDKIIEEVAPEIDNMGQTFLYRMALSAVDNDVEKFKSVLDNAEKLSPYKGNWSRLDENGGLKKGSYAVLLAMNGNNIEEARKLEEMAQECLGEYTPNIREISRLAMAYIASKQG